jgi:hypothetical protein
VSFLSITGVNVELFMEIAEKIRPLWEKRRDNLEEGGRNHSLYGYENHLLACCCITGAVTYEFPAFSLVPMKRR